MNPLIVIPSRMASTRLPGKPLADIHGEPMIVHVWRRAMEAGIGPVLVAAGEAEIAARRRGRRRQCGARPGPITPPAPTASSRRSAASIPAGRHDVIVNLQGDLPMVEPAALSAVLEPLAEPAVDIATLAIEIRDAAERDTPSIVKAVAALGPDQRVARALYFTRVACPSGEGPLYHHIGIYAYRRAALRALRALPPGRLEQREKLEQLRALEAGMRIDVALVDTVPFGVDTPADLERARALLQPRSELR